MLEELLLLRLLAAPDAALGEAQSRVRADLRATAADPNAGESAWRTAFGAAAERRRAAGEIEATGRGKARLRLTDAGRARARAVFGVAEEDAPKVGWAAWRDRYALPTALGVKRVDRADGLRVALLRRFYLPELSGDPGAGGLLATVDLLLARRLGVAASGAGALRAAALRAWLEGGKQKAEAGSGTEKASAGRLPEDLGEFAARVQSAARASRTGRFGENKVFISHVWAVLLAAEEVGAGEATIFKERLAQANTAGLLRLSRSDLAGPEEAADVRASETRYLGESFHFIRLD